MASSKLTVYLKAGRNANRKEQPHEAFANLRQDDDAAVKQFRKLWGPIAERPMMAEFGWQDILRRAWRGETNALAEIQKWVNLYLVTSLKFVDGRIEAEPSDLLGSIFLLFLRDHLSSNTAICENPECPSPYFIRGRNSQKFCEDGPCKAYGARIRANRWWQEHGDDWREANSKGRKK